MPTRADLTELAKVLYNTSSINSSSHTFNVTFDTSKASSMGFPDSGFYAWTGDELDSISVYKRFFLSELTFAGYDKRNYSYYKAVCLGD